MHIRVTLMEHKKEPLIVTLDYDENVDTLDPNATLLQIAVGGVLTRGSVTIPFEMLTALVAKVTQAAQHRQPMIIPKPGLIVTN